MAELVPGQPTAETPAAGSAQAPPTPEPTLLEHEAQFHETPVSADDEEAGEAGRTLNKRRHRAKKDQAGAGDVPRIQELTRKLREAEGKIAQPAAPASTPPPAATPEPAAPSTAYQPPPRQPQQPISQAFPAYEAFIAIPGNENASYDDYTDARADWRYQLQRAADRQQEAAEKAQREFSEKLAAHQQRVQAAKAKYPDFDTVVNAPGLPPITFVLRDAILASKQSDDIQYYLGTHPDELAQLVADSQDYSPSAVQVMRRYLDTLLSPSSRAAAVATGPALSLVPPPAPKPPSPVRTSALTPADEPPGDTGSLYDHEKFYGTPRQRRRRA